MELFKKPQTKHKTKTKAGTCDDAKVQSECSLVHNVRVQLTRVLLDVPLPPDMQYQCQSLAVPL